MSRSKTARKISEASGALGTSRIRLSRQSLASFPSVEANVSKASSGTSVTATAAAAAAAAGVAGAGAGAAGSTSALGTRSVLPSMPEHASSVSGLGGGSKWLEQERDNIQAYEYLCHCSEAQQWMERCIGEPLGGDIANMAEEMRNGIALAKLAKSFEPACVPRIFVHPKLQFRHTDNINYYFQFVDKIRLPNCFRFELTDLYEKKNFPKVVYCLHALSHFMAHHGRSDKVDDLVGKLEFNEEQLCKTQKTIDAAGIAMPSFGGVGQALAQEIGAGASAGGSADARTAGAKRAGANASDVRASSVQRAPEASALVTQRAHLRPVPASPTKAKTATATAIATTTALKPTPTTALPTGAAPHSVASLRAHLKPVDSEPTLRSTDPRARDALDRERERERDHDRQRDRERERIARMEERERARVQREQREHEQQERERERIRLRKERERRVQELERDRVQKRKDQQLERERERERLRLESQRELADDRERRERLYLNARTSTQRELALQREHESALRQRMEERMREAEDRARAQEQARADEREERFKRELEYEIQRKREMDAYAAELAAAHAETAAVEARLLALTEEAARRDAADRARAETRLAVPLQAAVRGLLARHAHNARCMPIRSHAATWTHLQAHVRGALVRQALYTTLSSLDDIWAVQMQAAVRGILARRSLYATIMQAEAHADSITHIQAMVRGMLARRALLAKMRAMDESMACATGLQAAVRGALARRAFRQMRMAFSRVAVVKAGSPASGLATIGTSRGPAASGTSGASGTSRASSVSGAPVSVRASLSRKKHHQELRKRMEYVRPDVSGIQAQIRGVLVRQDYSWWQAHLHGSVDVVVYLQAMLRGVLARRAFDDGLGRYLAHVPDIVRVQSLFRGRRASAHYQALLRGHHVPLETVRVYAHLLDDGSRDYDDEVQLTQMRTQVVQRIRENQSMETHVADLDRKIALLVKNQIGIEEIVKAKTERGWLGAGSATARDHVLTQANDPFAEHVLSAEAQKRLEQYQALFYLLQTQPTYLARLLVLTNAADVAEQERRQLEQTVLAMFAYAQQPREEYLLLKLVQATIHEQLPRVFQLDDWLSVHAPFQRMLIHFTCGVRERTYLCALLTPPVQRVMHEAQHTSLDPDPVAVQRAARPDAPAAAQAAATPDATSLLDDPAVRAEFLRRLQALRATCETFLHAIQAPSPPTPYGLQFVARAHFDALRERFPTCAHTDMVRTVAYIVYHSYLHPAVVAPELYGMPALGEQARRNLACVSQVLTQVALGTPFSDEHLYLQPLNEYVLDASTRLHGWIESLLTTYVDAEHHFGLDQWTDLGGTRRPVIYISPNEVYAIHQLLCTNVASLTDTSDDPLAELLHSLGMPPVSSTAELSRARDAEITLTLNPRLARVHDVDAEDKLLIVETKRLVMAVLRVQAAPHLLDLFVSPVRDTDEHTWAALRTKPPYAGTPTASLTFAELKAKALEHVLHLEQLGRVHRSDQYQSLVDAMAADIRSKDQRRAERRTHRDMLQTTLQKLQEQRAFMETQIHSYETCMDRGKHAMQKRTRRRMMALPFSPQFFHQRSLKAAGLMPAYGSFRYTATRLHAKGVLAHIERPDNLAIDQLFFTISSDEVGVFQIEATVAGILAGVLTLKMDDLLEAQYANEQFVNMLDGAIQFHLKPLIHFINKKFYT